MKKETANHSPALVRSLLLEAMNLLPEEAVVAYTDASAKDNRFACAIFIPRWDVKTSWKHSSTYPSLLMVCTDSKSCVQKLQNLPFSEAEDNCSRIWETAHCLKGSGCKVVLQWVPGHAGIEGNEEVDKLAKNALDDPLAEVLTVPINGRNLHHCKPQLR